LVLLDRQLDVVEQTRVPEDLAGRVRLAEELTEDRSMLFSDREPLLEIDVARGDVGRLGGLGRHGRAPDDVWDAVRHHPVELRRGHPDRERTALVLERLRAQDHPAYVVGDEGELRGGVPELTLRHGDRDRAVSLDPGEVDLMRLRN